MKIREIAMMTAAFLMAAAMGSAAFAADSDAVIGTQDLTDPMAVSKAEDYFTKEMGDGVQIMRFDAGRDINTALQSGSIDFGGGYGICPTVVGLTSGIDMKVIYVDGLVRGTEGLVVREGSGIEKAEDLKGKKIAVTLASSGHYALLCALQDAGLTADDVELVDMDPKATFSAWQRGDIDVAYTWNPVLTNIVSQFDGKLLLTGGDLAEAGHQTINFCVVRSDYAEEHPDQVTAYIKAINDGVQEYRDDPDQAVASIADYLGLSKDDVAAYMSDEYPSAEEQVGDDVFGSDAAANAMYSVAQFLKEQGQIPDAKDLDFYKNAIDTSYIEAALK